MGQVWPLPPLCCCLLYCRIAHQPPLSLKEPDVSTSLQTRLVYGIPGAWGTVTETNLRGYGVEVYEGYMGFGETNVSYS